MDCNSVESDVLVIGGGAAGTRAAIEAKRGNVNVLLVTKRSLGSGSTAVSGAVHAGVFSPEYGGDPEDSCEAHFRDTIEGGCCLNNQPLVRLIVENAARNVLKLERLGVRLSYVPFEQAERKLGGEGHSCVRSVGIHGGGGALMHQLTNMAKELGIETRENVMITDLLQSNGVAAGAIGFDTKTGKFTVFRSKATVLATGSGGQIYAVTSCMIDATGDGYGMAYRVGCTLQDMEFIQFYPWRLIRPRLYSESAPYTRVPVQSSVFSSGGRLLNSKGERFMERVDSVHKELTTRDIAARAIFNEIKSGNHVDGGVLLDISEVSDEDFLNSDRRYSLFKERGLDIRQTKMIVAPETHYFIGGVRVNIDCETDTKGLFAAGEIVGGVDGANRLAGNALTMCQVTGAVAGIGAARRAAELKEMPKISAKTVYHEIQETRSYLREGRSPEALRKKLQTLMWEKVGIIRVGWELKQALEEIVRLREDLSGVGVSDFLNLMKVVELKNLLDVAEMIIRPALSRQESRGAHYRSDYPRRDDEDWRFNLIIRKKEGRMTLTKAPIVGVTFT